MYIYLSKLSKIFTLVITEKTKKNDFYGNKIQCNPYDKINVQLGHFNPLSPKSDWHQISPYNYQCFRKQWS